MILYRYHDPSLLLVMFELLNIVLPFKVWNIHIYIYAYVPMARSVLMTISR